MDWLQRLEPSISGGNDRIWIGAPDERFWGLVVLFDEAVDRGLQVDNGAKDAIFEPASGELGEEAFDGVQPG